MCYAQQQALSVPIGESFVETLIRIGLAVNLAKKIGEMERFAESGTTSAVQRAFFELAVLFARGEVPLEALGDDIACRNAAEVVVTSALTGLELSVYKRSLILSAHYSNRQPLLDQFPSELLCVPSREGFDRYYHGTSIESATAIVTEGIDEARFAANGSDFGPAFYTSKNAAPALLVACQKTPLYSSPAVLVFDIPTGTVSPVFEIQDDVWPSAVTALRRGRPSSLEDLGLHHQFLDAVVVSGRISGNASAVDAGAVPIPSDHHQHAWKNGSRHVLRVLMNHLTAVVRFDRDDNWQLTRS
eukprot:c6656_g1_i1.p1 GENE.c6656_g1_i1~~c6656_g1_i1.p1  ORF type:complete len:301 (+),score=41.39 c6656_g1_i1:1046-1948(+)